MNNLIFQVSALTASGSIPSKPEIPICEQANVPSPFDVLCFYQTCNGSDPLAGVDDIVRNFATPRALQQLREFQSEAAAVNATVAPECFVSIETFANESAMITSITDAVLTELDCVQSVNPIYARIVYDGLCNGFVDGMYISYAAYILAAVFLMLALSIYRAMDFSFEYYGDDGRVEDDVPMAVDVRVLNVGGYDDRVRSTSTSTSSGIVAKGDTNKKVCPVCYTPVKRLDSYDNITCHSCGEHFTYSDAPTLAGAKKRHCPMCNSPNSNPANVKELRCIGCRRKFEWRRGREMDSSAAAGGRAISFSQENPLGIRNREGSSDEEIGEEDLTRYEDFEFSEISSSSKPKNMPANPAAAATTKAVVAASPPELPTPTPQSITPQPAQSTGEDMSKYDRMLKAGLPEGAIRNAMNRDGISEAAQVAFLG